MTGTASPKSAVVLPDGAQKGLNELRRIEEGFARHFDLIHKGLRPEVLRTSNFDGEDKQVILGFGTIYSGSLRSMANVVGIKYPAEINAETVGQMTELLKKIDRALLYISLEFPNLIGRSAMRDTGISSYQREFLFSYNFTFNPSRKTRLCLPRILEAHPLRTDLSIDEFSEHIRTVVAEAEAD